MTGVTTVGDLFKRVPWSDLIAALENGYDKIHAPSYEKARERILAMTPVDSAMTCCIEWVPADEFCDGYFNVYGDEGDGERFAIGFNPWAMWLSMPVKVVDCDLSEAQMLAHIMWEMTYYGFDDGTIKEVFDDISEAADRFTNATVEEIEAMIESGEVVEVKEE